MSVTKLQLIVQSKVDYVNTHHTTRKNLIFGLLAMTGISPQDSDKENYLA